MVLRCFLAFAIWLSASAHYHLGVLYWLEQDPNTSIPLLEAAVRLAPRQFDYRYRLGVAFRDVGHYSEAVREMKAAVELQPRNADAWNACGLALQKNGD